MKHSSHIKVTFKPSRFLLVSAVNLHNQLEHEATFSPSRETHGLKWLDFVCKIVPSNSKCDRTFGRFKGIVLIVHSHFWVNYSFKPFVLVRQSSIQRSLHAKSPRLRRWCWIRIGQPGSFSLTQSGESPISSANSWPWSCQAQRALWALPYVIYVYE